jgi:choline dehydrogenase-like flavoprotein
MGADPRSSVVSADGLHHHAEALAVIDGSVLPTSLGVNPSLTLYALAARSATRLAARITGSTPEAAPTSTLPSAPKETS